MQCEANGFPNTFLVARGSFVQSMMAPNTSCFYPGMKGRQISKDATDSN